MTSERRILIVDDEPKFTLALRRTLESKSYQVSVVENRSLAQQRLQAEEPDVLILGTIAPRGEAAQLHQWVRRHSKFRSLPILVVDAPSEQRLLKGWRIDEGMRMEADDYVTKPIEPGMLVPRIQRLLDKATRRIRVLVADDHAVVRDGIRAVLNLQRDIEVIGEAVDGRDAVEKVHQLLPDVVLMDIVMPMMNGLEATKVICQECPRAKVLILTQYDDEENAITASHAGAYGFISKRAAGSQLVAGIRSVHGGSRFVIPAAD